MENSGKNSASSRNRGKICEEKPEVLKLCFEDKLDEHFMVILSTIKKNIKNLYSDADRELAQVWLEKLCGEAFDGVELKRSRNIYLTRLGCQMIETESKLNPPFDEPPPEGKLTPAEITFKLQPPEEKRPEWLQELIQEDQLPSDISHTSQDGRTYLATHTMKDGQGAFAYLGVTVGADEPLWVGAGEDISSSSSKTSTKKERPVICRDPSSPEALISRLKENQTAWSNVEGRLKKVTDRRVLDNIKLLLEKRRSPEDCNGLHHFYDILLENISNEMENCGCGKRVHDAHVQHLLEKLEKDLEQSGENVCECEMPPEEKRMLMLELLYNRTEERKKTVQERTAALDRMERTIEGLDVENEESDDDLTEDPLWLSAVEQGPTDRNLKRLLSVYPPEIVERFAELLKEWRVDLLRRCRHRHRNLVAAMKKELEADAKLGFDKYKEARNSWMKVAQALQEVQEAQQRAKENEELESLVEKQATMKHAKGRARLVNELQAEFNDALSTFDDERKKGKKLREQIYLENQLIEDDIQLGEAAIDQLNADADVLRTEMMHLTYEIEDQETRIMELDQILDSICYQEY